MALLNIGIELFSLLDRLKPVHFPLLMDKKYGKNNPKLPAADLGMISGGIGNAEHLQVAQAMRKSCTTLVAFGTCATHGGIPAMRNQWENKEVVKTIFSPATTDAETVPHQDIPPLLDRVYSLDEQIHVDIFLPGCPPNPRRIARVLDDFLENRVSIPPTKSVCDTCPARRSGAGKQTIRRCTENVTYNPGKPLSHMQCLLEQGFLCMGPVTAAGCSSDGDPRCIKARMPCRGCFGPVRHGDNQMIGMLNALISKGVDLKTIIDRKSMLRFSGAHGLLRPIKKKPKD